MSPTPKPLLDFQPTADGDSRAASLRLGDTIVVIDDYDNGQVIVLVERGEQREIHQCGRPIVVKPLVWTHHTALDGTLYWACPMDSHAGFGIIYVNREQAFVWSCNLRAGWPPHPSYPSYPTLEAAQAAAQEEWTRFILSALEP